MYLLTEYTPHEPRSRESGSLPPERHLNLTSGLSAAVTRVVSTPSCEGDARVSQDRFKRETLRVSLDDTSGLNLDLPKVDVERLLLHKTCEEERGLLEESVGLSIKPDPDDPETRTERFGSKRVIASNSVCS